MAVAEKVSWNFELNVIKEYLSKFYNSDFACLREYIANAIAAQHRAGVADPIYVEISPERIVVEDSGIGISKRKFKKIFMWFGRSENKDIEGVQGKFGLGAKSFMMLTGDAGKVIMKTRSRETSEAYSAILTSTGAEIIDDGGKEDYGTRFEVYPEEPLTAEKVGKFYEEVAEHFDFSRIPVHIKAYADEPFEARIAGYELNVVKVDSKKMFTENVKLIEAVFGMQNHRVEIIEDNEVYELGILETVPYHELRWSSRDRTAVVVGDVLVDRGSSKPGFFLRIKVEDGRTVKVMGIDVKAPEPLPNRDGYRGLEEFLKVVKLLYEIRLFGGGQVRQVRQSQPHGPRVARQQLPQRPLEEGRTHQRRYVHLQLPEEGARRETLASHRKGAARLPRVLRAADDAAHRASGIRCVGLREEQRKEEYCYRR